MFPKSYVSQAQWSKWRNGRGRMTCRVGWVTTVRFKWYALSLRKWVKRSIDNRCMLIKLDDRCHSLNFFQRSSRTSVAANHGTPLYLSAFSLHDALPLIVQPWARVEQRQHRATPRRRQKEKECLTGNRGSVSQPSGTFSRPLGYASKNATFFPLSFTFLLALCSFLAK